MKDDEQFQQLMLQYNQLKNGSLDIKQMITNENYDNAITMIKNREALFLNCKCIRKYLELTDEQEKELNALLNELKESELENIKMLEEGMAKVKIELKKTQQTSKFQKAYQFNEDQNGHIINYTEEDT